VLRLFRGCLTLIGLIVLLGVGYSVYRTYVKPPPPLLSAAAPVPAGAPPPPTAAALEARLASAEAVIRQNAAAGRHVPVMFTVSDAELTARINQALSRGEVQIPVSDVKVTTVPGVVNMSGQATKLGPITVPFTMTAAPRVNSGKAQLQVTALDFGPVPVPGLLAAQLTGLVASDNVLGDVPLAVSSFRAEPGRLVLEGTT
jgi:hypothetical protein